MHDCVCGCRICLVKFTLHYFLSHTHMVVLVGMDHTIPDSLSLHCTHTHSLSPLRRNWINECKHVSVIFMCVYVFEYAQMKVNGFNVRICVLISNLEIGVVNLANAVIIKSRSYHCCTRGKQQIFSNTLHLHICETYSHFLIFYIAHAVCIPFPHWSLVVLLRKKKKYN